MERLPLIEKNIIINGLTAVGKTTVGQHLAKQMYRDFIDVEQVIVKKMNMSVSEVFATYGEEFFREKEREVVSEICKGKLKIVALSEGAFTQKEIRHQCLNNCSVFFLDSSFHLWKERVNNLVEMKPILKGLTFEEMRAYYFQRRSSYELCHSKVNTDGLKVEEVAHILINSIKLGWELYPAYA